MVDMKLDKYCNPVLKIGAAGVLVTAFFLTFTLSDYYIFNRFAQYGFFFCLSQWVKKAGLLLIPLAVFYGNKRCAATVKYVLPLFVVLSCCLYGDFFNATKIADSAQQEIYNGVNLFLPVWLNMTLFFTQNALMLLVCASLFVRDGARAEAKDFLALPCALLLCMPLNLFENFFDIARISADSPLRFRNFTVWHFLAIVVLVSFTVGCYAFLKNRGERQRDLCLAALAIALLVQYHSKDSMVMGDGYNVYHTVFACIPLFICNIGVYAASLSVLLKKKTLYAVSFFIHAAGALTVFVYFGKDSMSDYGIFCSYSILYFCFTHCFLFALSVLPSALGRYKFVWRDCVVPLVYYFIVIVTASVASALVTSASSTWHTADGVYLPADGLLTPNYAFTQINPLPFEVPPVLTVTIWKYEINLLYILGLYLVYVALFFAFIGLYYAFLAVRRKWTARRVSAPGTQPLAEANADAVGETAATDDDGRKD